MTASTPGQATVTWWQLKLDLLLVAGAVIAPIAFYHIDVLKGQNDWFMRSGAIIVILSGWLAYRSLSKHYEKFFRHTGPVPRTSLKQKLIDKATMGLLVLGTLVWAYGDKVFAWLHCH